MKDQILKLAGVKTEKQFYKKFPSEEAFMKVHGKAFKKAAMGASMVKDQLTQLTDFSNPPQAQAGIVQSPYSTSISSFNKLSSPLDVSSPRALGGLGQTGVSSMIGDMRTTQFGNTGKMMGNFQSGQAIGAGLDKGVGKITGASSAASKATPYIGAGMDVIEGVSMIKDQTQAVRGAKQNAMLTGVQAQAAGSKPKDATKNYYTRPEDVIIQPEQLYPSYGVGTNILSAQDGAMVGGNPTEIQNTYDPNTMYTDLGYEPLNDSDQVKAFYTGGKLTKAQSGFSASLNNGGFGDFMTNQGGSEALGNISSMLINKGKGPSAGSKIGGGIGAAAGTFFGGPVGGAIGKFAGEALGSMIDSSGRKIEGYNQQSNANIAGMMGSYIPQQFGNVMEDGGYVSHDWTPQLITKFGEYNVEDLLQPPNDADMLRAGGHLKSYTPPSEKAMYTGREKFAMGGDLKVYRGEAETMSYNPYLPDGGETIMFKGPSHDNGGMPIEYGSSPVEVEGGEPAVKLKNGTSGDSSLVVYGNLINPRTGRKFKKDAAETSKKEAKENKKIDKASTGLDNLDVNTSYDKIALDTYKAIIDGGNMKLQQYAEEKMEDASMQSAINDTAEEYGVVADDLAQGKIKIDKKAKKEQAQWGKNLSEDALRRIVEDQDYIDSKKIDYSYGVETMDQNPLLDNTNYGTFLINSIMDKQRGVPAIAPYLPGTMGQEFTVTGKKPSIAAAPSVAAAKPASTKAPAADAKKEKFPWMDIVNQALPYFRPSDQEPLDPRQLTGEMYALSQNQLEPVQAQTYQPQLQTPYDISLQDQLNEVTAQTRQAERLAQGNPAALAAIYGQAEMAKSKILGEQMRINQEQRGKTYAGNIGTLNQAQLQNLQTYDTQQQRQEAAKSATKATTQAALNSVASKFAQNQLANRQLATMENLYNYRYDKSGRAINMNPLVDFDAMIANASPDELSKYKALLEAKSSKEKPDTKSARNGSIVRSIKNL